MPLIPGAESALATAARQARDYVAQSKAANTRRAYAADWRHFTTWCQMHQLSSLPAAPDTAALYLAALAETAKVSTLTRRLSAISQIHQMAEFPSPAQDIRVRTVMAGIRRAKRTAQQGKKPLLTDDLRSIAGRLPGNLQGLRDRALLLVGFAAALRRSELVGLDIADLEFSRDGLIVTVRRSKTDPEGQGRRVGIPYGSHPETCPIRALEAWLERLQQPSGPVFRPIDQHGHVSSRRLSDRAVALIVKRSAAKAGLDPAGFAGHSLRAGLATAAAAAGVNERAIMAQTGHRSVITLRKYIREGSLFLENAAAKVGL